MPGKIYSTEKKNLLNTLTPEEIKTIQKDNPFKHERNAKIRELMQRGVSCNLLAEIAGGLGKSSIHRIGQHGNNRAYPIRTETQCADDYEKIEKAVNAFSKEIKKILNHRRND